jgi:hypothetical protein
METDFVFKIKHNEIKRRLYIFEVTETFHNGIMAFSMQTHASFAIKHSIENDKDFGVDIVAVHVL